MAFNEGGKSDECRKRRRTIGVILGLYGISRNSLFVGRGKNDPSLVSLIPAFLMSSSMPERSYGIVRILDTVVYTIRSAGVIGAKAGMAPTIIRIRGEPDEASADST